MSDRKPEDTLRDGAIKSTIWKNQSAKGNFYSAQITKTYRDEDGQYHDGNSFTSNDMLRVSEIARATHHRINRMGRDNAPAKSHQPAPERR